MEKLYVPLGEVPTNRLQGAEIPFTPLEGLTRDLAQGKQIILVGTTLDVAETEAWKLAGAGLPAKRISILGSAEEGSKPRSLFWRDAKPLREAPENSDFDTYPSGIDFLDINLRWRWRLRELMVIAGPYSSGKSTIIQQLAFNFIAANGRDLGDCSALICAWEDEAADMRRNLERFIAHQRKTTGEILDHLLDRIHYVCRPADEERLLPWYIDLVEFYSERYNCRFFSLDPWNEMDHKKDNRQIETDYVRDAMRMFRKTVDVNKIILPIATHVPAKMIRGDGGIEPFKIAHAFGSGNFGNKADRGLCIVRTKKFAAAAGHTIWRLDKSKVEERMGIKGTVASRLDTANFNLEYDGHVTKEVQDIWKD